MNNCCYYLCMSNCWLLVYEQLLLRPADAAASGLKLRLQAEMAMKREIGGTRREESNRDLAERMKPRKEKKRG